MSYMTYKKAKELTLIDYSKKDIETLLKKRVEIIDALRLCSGIETAREYGLLLQAIDGGFYIDATTHSIKGFAPRDAFLAQNLKTSYEKINEILGRKK